jgi:hypothetical protein
MKHYNIIIKYIIGLVGISFCFFLFLEISAPPMISLRNSESVLKEVPADSAHSIFREFVYNINDKYYIVDTEIRPFFQFVYIAFFIQFVYTLFFIILSFIVPRLKKKLEMQKQGRDAFSSKKVKE